MLPPVTTVFFEMFGIVKAVPRVGADPTEVTLGTLIGVPRVGADPTDVTFGTENAVPRVGTEPTLVTFGTVVVFTMSVGIVCLCNRPFRMPMK